MQNKRAGKRGEEITPSVAGRRQSWTETKSAGVGTPDDGGRLPPREKPATSLTGEQICTGREGERERAEAPDNGRRRRAPDDGTAGRRSRRRH